MFIMGSVPLIIIPFYKLEKSRLVTGLWVKKTQDISFEQVVYVIMTFYVIIWCNLWDLSSISSYFILSMSNQFLILFSLIWINPSKLMQLYLYLISALFSLICFFLMAQLFYVWNWWEIKAPQCILSTQVTICKLVGLDYLCHELLSLLLQLTLSLTSSLGFLASYQAFIILQDKWRCDRVTVIFSICIITSIVAIIHTIYILNQKSWLLL